MTIIDLDGKTIRVTNLKEAIDQAKFFTTLSSDTTSESKYWNHSLSELLKLEEPKPIEVETIVNGKELPYHVIETRKIFAEQKGVKGFIKNDKHQPLFGIYSCARTMRYHDIIDALEVGESTKNGSGRKITRIY